MDVIHDCIFDFDENLNLIGITRNYYPSFEAMEEAHRKFKEEHPDIVERRGRGMIKLLEEE